MHNKIYYKIYGKHLSCDYSDIDGFCCAKVSAIYVSSDSKRRAIYICSKHAKQAETGGDGPVFWFDVKE